jgi:hypothetical protein
MTGGPMPYVMDTGPYLSVLEDRLSDAIARTHILSDLRHDVALATIAGLDSTTLVDDQKQPDERVRILNECWFGMTQGAGKWLKQPNAVPTGFWNGYQGDPEAILRAALIRAVEVSLGVDHGADPVVRTRAWPIALTWICQGPFFQCWVSWREEPGGTGGHVALTITSPAAEGLPLKPKITRTNVKPEYAHPPAVNAWTAERGMWVLGHEDYMPWIVYSTTGSLLGQLIAPELQWRRKSTAVVCVAPAEWEGGVLAAGRPYRAPLTP